MALSVFKGLKEILKTKQREREREYPKKPHHTSEGVYKVKKVEQVLNAVLRNMRTGEQQPGHSR